MKDTDMWEENGLRIFEDLKYNYKWLQIYDHLGRKINLERRNILKNTSIQIFRSNNRTDPIEIPRGRNPFEGSAPENEESLLVFRGKDDQEVPRGWKGTGVEKKSGGRKGVAGYLTGVHHVLSCLE